MNIMQSCTATFYSGNVATVYSYRLKNMQISLVPESCSKPVWKPVSSAEVAKANKAVYLIHNISAIRPARSCVCG